jgi:hypothetical protein
MKDEIVVVKDYFYNEGYYSGPIINFRPNGEGYFRQENGLSYTGTFKHGIPHGKGTSVGIAGIYDGDFIEGLEDGNGIYKSSTGEIYIGEFKHGERNGYGVLKFRNGDIWKGSWINGRADNEDKEPDPIEISLDDDSDDDNDDDNGEINKNENSVGKDS